MLDKKRMTSPVNFIIKSSDIRKGFTEHLLVCFENYLTEHASFNLDMSRVSLGEEE